MFWTILSLALLILLPSAATTKSWSDDAEELASIRLQTGPIYSIEDEHLNFIFRLSIGAYDSNFRVHTSLAWVCLTT
jgi:hypothetical protein